MNCKKKYVVFVAGACFMLAAGGVSAQGTTAKAGAASYKPTVDDWVGVNDAVDNYTLGLELHDMARFDKAFWPEATITAQPEPGKSFTMPYRAAAAGPPKPPPGTPMPAMPAGNAIGGDIPPWHLSLSHHFEFQSATRATHYGYFVSVYPDLKTKTTTVGLPGHYDDTLEKRDGEWRILQRTTVIGGK
ncbi:nuclear transport factor 2 family protein [Hydrocarboniphaga sp.]|uniref:nuclear transport factor 2 family protein n=1 Tax=Hydrocarboniphaga sp. TaxID=2033016 RepID=UPI003D0BC732